MTRFFLFLLSGLVFSGPVLAASVSEPDFGTREVLCVVEFSQGSNDLTASSRAAVESVLSRLKQVDTQQQLIRIEGFARPDEKNNNHLAYDRALAIDELLRFRYGNRGERFITGIVYGADYEAASLSPCRAEIVIYDNLFSVASESVEIASKEFR